MKTHGKTMTNQILSCNGICRKQSGTAETITERFCKQVSRTWLQDWRLLDPENTSNSPEFQVSTARSERPHHAFQCAEIDFGAPGRAVPTAREGHPNERGTSRQRSSGRTGSDPETPETYKSDEDRQKTNEDR